uniref:PARP-type domain-containing protein n=1 Tax=Panagrolaimus davidi TaxID=227884 RepID=A0A914PBR0_9BILA
MTDNCILFQNAPKRRDCNECQKIIPAGHLEVVYQKFYHFDCFFKKKEIVCNKTIISIATEEYMDENEEPKTFVSLEDIDCIGGFNLRISDADLSKIREHLALAKGLFIFFS